MPEFNSKFLFRILKSIPTVVGWCFVGAVGASLLFFVTDGFVMSFFVMGFTVKPLTFYFYPFFERHIDTFHDSLAWDPYIYFFVAVIGGIIGFVFGIWKSFHGSSRVGINNKR